MDNTPLFLGLTRQVSFAGLPVNYMVVLMGAVMLGFILTGSFLYLLASGIVGYLALRALAAYDPNIVDVFIVTVQRTRMSPELLRGEGLVYRA